MSATRPRRAAVALSLLSLALVAGGCELVNPEVVVQNDLGAPVQIRDISFNGCIWPAVLAPGEATSACACPPAEQRARFKKFDAQSYFNKILEDLARGSQDYLSTSDRVGVRLPTPLWYSYRTISTSELGYGWYQVIHIRPDDIEQDFDVPGPMGTSSATLLSLAALCLLWPGTALGNPVAAPATAPAPAAQGQEEYSTVVRARRTRRPDDETAARSPIQGATLRNSPRPSLVEAVAQEAPWVYVTSRGASVHGIAEGASGAIKMRGLGGSPNTEILVVQDGVPDYQGIFGHPLPDTLLPALVEDVEVIAGGDSVLYGTNALGGVIRINSRWRREQGAELHLKAGYGSYNTRLLQPALLARWRSWDTVLSFHDQRSDGHRPGAGGTLDAGQLGTRFLLGHSARLTVRARLAHLHGWDPGPVTSPNTDHFFDALRLGTSATLEHFHSKLAGRAVAYASLGRHALHDGFHSLDVTDGGYVEERWRPHRTVELLLGAAADHVDGQVLNRISGQSQTVQPLLTFSLVQQVSWRPWSRWLITAGAREVISPTYGFILLYKAGTALSLWRGGRLRARYATNFATHEIRERYLPYPVANPDLKPEQSASLEVGVAQRLGRHVEAELTGFRTAATDLIKTFGTWPAAEVVNIDELVLWGVEGLVRLRRVGPFALLFGGTALRIGRYTKQNPSAKLDGRLSFDHGPIHAALSGEWVGGLYMNNYGRDPQSDVFFLDLEGRYQVRQLRLDLFLVLRNLTNRDNAYLAGYPLPRFHAFGGVELHL